MLLGAPLMSKPSMAVMTCACEATAAQPAVLLFRHCKRPARKLCMGELAFLVQAGLSARTFEQLRSGVTAANMLVSEAVLQHSAPQQSVPVAAPHIEAPAS